MSNKVEEVIDPKTKVITHHLKNNSGETLSILEENADEELNDVYNGEVEDYITARYTNGNGDEFDVIFNENGNLIKKGVFVESFIKKRNEFIITTNHSGNDTLYNSWGSNPDELFAVIDYNGNYILEPEWESIELNELGLYVCNKKYYYEGSEELGELVSDFDEKLLFKRNDKYFFYSKDGTSEEYDWVSKNDISLRSKVVYLVKRNNKYGLIDDNAEIFLKLDYDEIIDNFIYLEKEVENEGDVPQFFGILFIVKIDGRYQIKIILEDETVVDYMKLSTWGIKSVNFFKTNLNQYLRGEFPNESITLPPMLAIEKDDFYETEIYELSDTALKVKSSTYEYRNGIIISIFKRNNKYGVISYLNGINVAIPFEYDNIFSITNSIFRDSLEIVTYLKEKNLYQNWVYELANRSFYNNNNLNSIEEVKKSMIEDFTQSININSWED
jgi:hypothetical protein